MSTTESTHLLYFQELGKCLPNKAVKNLHSKDPSYPLCLCAKQESFIKSIFLYIFQKVQISTHCLPCTNHLQYLPLSFIYLFVCLFTCSISIF